MPPLYAGPADLWAWGLPVAAQSLGLTVRTGTPFIKPWSGFCAYLIGYPFLRLGISESAKTSGLVPRGRGTNS